MRGRRGMAHVIKNNLSLAPLTLVVLRPKMMQLRKPRHMPRLHLLTRPTFKETPFSLVANR